jgi:hypothetical protein
MSSITGWQSKLLSVYFVLSVLYKKRKDVIFYEKETIIDWQLNSPTVYTYYIRSMYPLLMPALYYYPNFVWSCMQLSIISQTICYDSGYAEMRSIVMFYIFIFFRFLLFLFVKWFFFWMRIKKKKIFVVHFWHLTSWLPASLPSDGRLLQVITRLWFYSKAFPFGAV